MTTYYGFVGNSLKIQSNSIIDVRQCLVYYVYGDGKKGKIATDKAGKNVIERLEPEWENGYTIGVNAISKGTKKEITADGTIVGKNPIEPKKTVTIFYDAYNEKDLVLRRTKDNGDIINFETVKMTPGKGETVVKTKMPKLVRRR